MTSSALHPRRARRAVAGAVLAVVLLLAPAVLAGCGAGSGSDGADGQGGSDPAGTVTVLAAASLSDAFTELAVAFEAAHPGTQVQLAFGASSSLAQQVVEGAPADVVASADEANMQKVVEAGLVEGEPRTFATNELQIVVEPGDPLGIEGLADLARPGVLYVSCAPEVPIGRYSAQVLERAGVTVAPASLEPDVKGILAKVTAGEADAGIVYATDVRAAGDRAAGVAIPEDQNVVARYPAAVTTGAGNRAGAEAWLAFLTGPEGRSVLAGWGFGPP